MTNRAITRLFFLSLVILGTLTAARAAEAEKAPRPGLPERAGTEWIATGAAVRTERRQWPETADSAIMAEYGLEELVRRTYRQSGKTVSVELFTARKTAGAYGWWSFLRRQSGQTSTVHHHGRFVIRLEPANGEASLPAATPSLVDSLRQSLGESDREVPVLPAHLPNSPTSGLISGSEVYLVGPQGLARDPLFGERTPLIDFSGLPEMATADYQSGNSTLRLLLVEFHTPQSASEAHLRWLEATGLKDGSTPGGDPPRFVRRIGNYLVELVGTADPGVADSLLNQIRYEQKVYWAGRKISDIPLQFRPLDPAVLREATRTGSIIVRSLIWVGVMLLLTVGAGLVIGGIFFYWRRFRQHRSGSDDKFSDGGGSIVLNLRDED